MELDAVQLLIGGFLCSNASRAAYKSTLLTIALKIWLGHNLMRNYLDNRKVSTITISFYFELVPFTKKGIRK